MAFNVSKLKIEGAYALEPKIFYDERGFFYESFNIKDIRVIVGEKLNFVQDNHSFSNKNVLRGLHFQIKKPQGKLVRVVSGEIFDVIVDLRLDSPTFKKWDFVILSSKNSNQLWVPPGLAHGFLVMSETADVLYKTTDFWYPENEKTLYWNDDSIGIKWPMTKPIVSKKDLEGESFKSLEKFFEKL